MATKLNLKNHWYMQAYDDDVLHNIGQRLMEIKYSKLCSMTTKLCLKNHWQLRVMMTSTEVKGQERSNVVNRVLRLPYLVRSCHSYSSIQKPASTISMMHNAWCIMQDSLAWYRTLFMSKIKENKPQQRFPSLTGSSDKGCPLMWFWKLNGGSTAGYRWTKAFLI